MGVDVAVTGRLYQPFPCLVHILGDTCASQIALGHYPLRFGIAVHSLLYILLIVGISDKSGFRKTLRRQGRRQEDSGRYGCNNHDSDSSGNFSFSQICDYTHSNFKKIRLPAMETRILIL